ncbi:survival motor neuron protein [Achroia grisella]|uniref:survival motor neuron protein n=1 Tax=Achroia grisella TaxID=688607 RepID=UPI0027D33CCA|nr:survival motor neuron protein [Achroia grisella]
MSRNEILYVKGMNISESEVDDEEQDIWDDRKLNDAYDKALQIANAEVAKRIALSTNTNRKSNDQPDNKKDKTAPKPSTSKNNKKEPSTKWKSGMHCRALYEEDGLEYEAFILSVLNDKECVVRFLGYENSEIVPINTLKPTLGKTERTKQIEEALSEKAENPYANASPDPEQMEFGSNRDEASSNPEPVEQVRSCNRKQKTKKKKNNKHINGYELPELPSLPNLAMLLNSGPNDVPLPPPPPLGFHTSNRTDSEEQAISSMLLSWYMSGYYTGLYQGLKRAREGKRNP